MLSEQLYNSFINSRSLWPYVWLFKDTIKFSFQSSPETLILIFVYINAPGQIIVFDSEENWEGITQR